MIHAFMEGFSDPRVWKDFGEMAVLVLPMLVVCVVLWVIIWKTLP